MKNSKHWLFKKYLKIDKELIIILLLVSITAIIFFVVYNQRGFLNFFYLPTLLAAYFFGKRYAALSAIFSFLLIGIVAHAYPETFRFAGDDGLSRWLDIVTWGGFLLIAGYSMGHLYEKKEEAIREVRNTYMGIIEMLSVIIDSVDQETQSHSRRVSLMAAMMAKGLGLPQHEVENIRIAALLHDLGKIGVNHDVLLKVGRLTAGERALVEKHTGNAVDILAPIGGQVLDLLPIILHHHEKYDGSGYNALKGDNIPLGARIVAVADVYDALVSDRPYRKALTPLQAKSEITSNAGMLYDPRVVNAFETFFPMLESESYFSTAGLGM